MTLRPSPMKPRAARPALLVAAFLLGLPGTAAAQDPAGAPVQMMQVDARKLVDQFVEAGMLTPEQADRMIRNALVPAETAAPLMVAQAPTPAAEPGVQTIPYIPEVVRRQIRDELRAEVTQQARAEGWAAPGETAEWTQRITLSGDIRVRGEGIFFDPGNDPDIVDFNRINTGAPYNINRAVPGSVNPPYVNTLEDRNRARIRARLGLNVRLDDWISGEIRLATGNDSSPVSTNQTLGSGNLDKYQIWLDRGNIQLTPVEGLRIDLGRAENPFWTSDLLFDPDLNFDGVSARYRFGSGPAEGIFLSGGAFPIYNTELNFGSSGENEGPYESHDKWLAAVQVGADWAASENIVIRGALGYFHFADVEGVTSQPCLFDQDVCDTDNTRPQFQQFGNTVFALRDIIPDPDVAPGLSPEPQYFGLASEFEILNLHLQADIASFNPVRLRIEGDLVKNLAFDQGAIAGRAINNFDGLTGDYDGGDMGWYVNFVVGHPEIVERGQWSLSAGYKYLESDAVIDGFADSDFHLGGTNTQGYILGGAYGLGRNTSITARWLSGDEITGQPFAVDVLQIDLNAGF